LITSRVVFPRFETSSLRALSIDDAGTLFCRFALPNDGKKKRKKTGTHVPDEQCVQQVCYMSNS